MAEVHTPSTNPQRGNSNRAVDAVPEPGMFTTYQDRRRGAGDVVERQALQASRIPLHSVLGARIGPPRHGVHGRHGTAGRRAHQSGTVVAQSCGEHGRRPRRECRPTQAGTDRQPLRRLTPEPRRLNHNHPHTGIQRVVQLQSKELGRESILIDLTDHNTAVRAGSRRHWPRYNGRTETNTKLRL